MATLSRRARLLADIRLFFHQRGVMEVETPCLESSPALAAGIDVMRCGQRYLRSSPEYAMKRLLAAGSGDIYQLAKVFRGGECGRAHNPEFTMLEWYRIHWNYRQLANETVDLLNSLSAPYRTMRAARFISCQEAFSHYFGLDALRGDKRALLARCHELGFASCDNDYDAFNFLADELARRHFSDDQFTVLYDYPAQQAQLAKAGSSAERYEIYLGAVELANGCSELSDSDACERRLRNENALRARAGKRALPLDHALLDALRDGLADCAGVSLGVDRLLMCLSGQHHVAAGMAFAWDNA